ncbi:hypothetical protein [Streptomyces sp. NPDC001999]
MGDTRVDDRGLAEDGTIGREGPPSRVPAAFAPAVEAARSRITDAFDAAQLCSACLYGSIPRGTAIPGVHDLDLPLARYAEPTAQMRVAAATGRTPSADPALRTVLIDDLAPWPAAEYLAAHGSKAPRR